MEIGVVVLLAALVGFLAKKKDINIGITVKHEHQHNYKHEYQELPQTPAPVMSDKELEEQEAGAIDSVIKGINEIMGVTYEEDKQE